MGMIDIFASLSTAAKAVIGLGCCLFAVLVIAYGLKCGFVFPRKPKS